MREQFTKPEEIDGELENVKREEMVARRKIMIVSPDLLVKLIGSGKWFRFNLGELCTLPDEAIYGKVVVLGVSADFQSNSMLVSISHPSFPKVPQGQMAPAFNAPWLLSYEEADVKP